MASLVIRSARLRRAGLFVLTLLLVEFLDELVFGMREVAWPLIRADLNLDYVQIGLLIGVPGLVAGVIEMLLGILADMGYRRRLILGGGLMFAFASLASALSGSFWALMLSFWVFYPASGAFVSLSQAALMDVDPKRHEHNMARWTFAGALGVFAAPLALGMASGNWRGLYAAFAVLTLVIVVIVSRFRIPENGVHGESLNFREGFTTALRDLRRLEVVRWLTLLQFSDLMLDVLYGYLALYLVDVVGVDIAAAGLAVAVWTGVGLVGDLLIIPLLERVRGLTYLRFSALSVLALYPAFLLVPGFVPKVIILGLLGMFNAGWYSVLQAQVYSAMPDRSGSVLTVSNIFGFIGSLLPFVVGAAAQAFGLHAAMWMLLLGPVALLLGIPRHPASDETR